MVKVHTINISSEKIGIGKLIHPSKTGGIITGRLLGKMQAIYYRITTQYQALTGKVGIMHRSPFLCTVDSQYLADVPS